MEFLMLAVIVGLVWLFIRFRCSRPPFQWDTRSLRPPPRCREKT